MKQIDLESVDRSGKPNALRAQGIIPAVVYGKGMEAISLGIEAAVFKKVISGTSGSNVIINLKTAKGQSLPVITQEIQKNHITDQILHIDFHRIRMDEAIKTKVPVVLVGIAAGVKEDAGILVHPMTELEIRCLPTAIPEKIEINISALKINDAIHVSELKVPTGIEVLSTGQDIVVTIAPPAKEEVVAAPVAAVPVEGAVPAEGAAAAVPGATAADGKAVEGKPAAKEAKPAAKEAKK
jgi:large subunit ribosomal protein L25